MAFSGRQRVLVPRGAIPPEKLALLAQMEGKAVKVSEQCDSGFCDDDDESRTKSMEYSREIEELNSKDLRCLEESTQNLSIGDPRSGIRHPSCDHPSRQEGRSAGENIVGYARYSPIHDQLRQRLFTQDEDGDTALHLAIANMRPRETDAMIKLVPFRECLDMYNYLRQTPLHLATITRQPFIIRRLLEAGGSPHIPDRNGKTALHLACEHGFFDCVMEITRPLLDKSWSEEIRDSVYRMLDERDYNGLTALHLAVSVSNVKVVEYLVSLGANVDARDGKSGRSALHYAVEAGNLLMINSLLQCHADINAMTFDECTPLHIAAGRGMASVVALLLAFGADPRQTTYEGESAQMLASSPEVCKMLTSC